LGDFGWVFELRWILAGIGAVLLVGIFWWGSRRGGRGRHLGARATGLPSAPSVAPGAAPPAPTSRRFEDPDDFGVPPFEPLSIRSGDYDEVPVLDLPMRADTAALPEQRTAPALAPAAPAAGGPREARAAERCTGPAAATPRPASAPALQAAAAAGHTAPALQAAAAAGHTAPTFQAAAAAGHTAPPGTSAGLEFRTAPGPHASTASEQQKILSFRVSARGAGRWSGRELMAALDAQGLAFGRYGVFHRNDAEGRSLFCIASLIEPGSFDVARMPDQEFRGISAFAVLPGNAAPLPTFDALLATVCGLAEALTGIVQDARGATLSAERAHELREDVVQFQARLS